MGRYARNSIGQYAPVGAAADDLPGGATPTGKKTIDTTAEVDVASYATAQVTDENLVAGNIKKDVVILGTTGSYEGGGSSDFSTAEVTLVLTPPEGVTLTGWGLINANFLTGNITWNPDDTLSAETNKIILPMAKNANNVICGYFEDFFGADAEYNEYRQSPDSVILSGNIEYDSDQSNYVVTGNCTITANVTPESP